MKEYMAEQEEGQNQNGSRHTWVNRWSHMACTVLVGKSERDHLEDIYMKLKFILI
jgi:hypothetical protein